MCKLLPLPSVAEAEQQDGIEHAGQDNGQHHGLTHAGHIAAGILDALRDGLEASQEEGGGGQDGQNAAEHAVVGDLLQTVGGVAVDGGVGDVIDGLPVVCVAADQGGDGTDDSCTNQDEAQDLLNGSSGSQATHVQGEQQQGGDRADDDGDEIDGLTSHLVQNGTGLDAGDQITQNVGDLNGFPGDDGHECAKRRPAGDERHCLIERLVSKGHAAAGHGEHGDQLAVAQGNGHHHDQSHDVADSSGNGAAAAGHPTIDGHGPAHADDSAKADAEKVNGADTLLFGGITHLRYLFSSDARSRLEPGQT